MGQDPSGEKNLLIIITPHMQGVFFWGLWKKLQTE